MIQFDSIGRLYKSKVAKIQDFLLKGSKKLREKGENAGYQHFLFPPRLFQKGFPSNSLIIRLYGVFTPFSTYFNYIAAVHLSGFGRVLVKKKKKKLRESMDGCTVR